jgi:iron complex outermembrane receptor protein
MLCSLGVPLAALAQDAPPEVELGATAHAERPPETPSRLSVPLLETPATVNVVDSRLLAERGQSDFVTALANVPGVNPALHYGGFDYLTIRGFGSADFLILTDGFRDERHPLVGGEAPVGSLVGIDRIEVLKGPASALYGLSALGGVINVLHKQPQATPAYEASGAFGSYGDARATLGATGPVLSGGDDTLLYRADFSTQRAGDFRGFEQMQTGATMALRWQPTARHVINARLFWTDSTYGTDSGIPTVDGRIPSDVSFSNRYNTPYDHLDYTAVRGNAEWTATLTDQLTLRERFSIAREREDYLSAEGLSAEDGDVARSFFRFDHHFSPMLSNQLELIARMHALVDHELLVAYDFSYVRNRSPSGFADAPVPIDLVDPVEPSGRIAVPVSGKSRLDQQIHGALVSDQMSIVPQLKLALGARVDLYRAVRRNDTLDEQSGDVTMRGDERKDDAVSPSFRAGAVYLPVTWLSVYGSVATSVRPVPRPSILDPSVDLDPERGLQFEIGSKVELDAGLSAFVAAYQIEKTNLLITHSDMSFDQVGKARSRGGELGVNYTGHGFRVDAGYALTDVRYVDYLTDDADFADKHLTEVPVHMVTLWSTWRSPWGPGVGLGGRFASQAFADSGNTVKMPAYLLADAALFWEWTRGSLWLNVKNLFDDNVLNSRGLYYASALYDTQVTPGAPCTVLLQGRLYY